MKKIILSLALVFGVGLVVQAQETEGQFRPVGGEKNLEVNFSPLGGTPVTIPGIKFRSFSSNNSAFRLGVFVGYNSDKTIDQEEFINDDNEVTASELIDRSSSFSISVQPGYEWHMTGTDRLSPYVGGFVNVGYTSMTDRDESQSAFGIGDASDPDLYVEETKTTTGQLNLGLNLVAGFDYYFAEHLYIGTEVGFGFFMNNDLTSKTTATFTDLNEEGDTYIEVTEESDTVQGNTSGFQLGPNVIGQIRVGWLF